MSMNDPMVSIGLPVYNGEIFIRKALDSLLKQDYDNFELIISDNASTDSTLFICKEYAEKDCRIRIITNENNKGILNNFGLVLKNAKGKYFMWAGCDDYWEPTFVSTLVNFLEKNSSVSVVMSGVKKISQDNTIQNIQRFSFDNDPQKMSSFQLARALAEGKPYHLFFYGLYRRTILMKAFENFPTVAAGDRLFMCQLALAAKFGYIDEVLQYRLITKEPINIKFAQEEFGKIWQDPLALVKTAFFFIPYLSHSKIILKKNRKFIPIIGAAFLLNVIIIHIKRVGYTLLSLLDR